MANEGEENVDTNPDAEEIKPDEQGKHPETVPWSKYVGIKESLGSKLDAEREKVKSLEEQLANAPNAEEFGKIKEELDTAKNQLQEKTTELTSYQQKTVTELKAELKKRGVSDEKVEKMSETEMRTVLGVLGDKKPSPDMGGGGGSGELKGSPSDLARQAYESSNVQK